MSGVRLYSAGRASQNMCRQPRASLATDIAYSSQSFAIQEAQSMITQHGGITRLSESEVLYLNHLDPKWREKLPEALLD